MPFNFERGFKKMLEEFCNNTSLSGYKYTVEKDRSLFERIIWIFCHILLMTGTIYIVLNLWSSFTTNPTVTTLKTTSFPVTEVEFPGVSICNVNKISKAKALNLAKYLSEISYINESEAYTKIFLLGNMYDLDAEKIDQLIKMQAFLDYLDMRANISLHIRDLLKSLMTPCEDLLKSCIWGGETVECMQIFEMRETFEGFCCVFNYLKPKNMTNGLQRKKALYQRAGLDHGLRVLVNNDPDDYTFSLISVIGVKVHIFHPADYPDASSGSLVDNIIGMGTETFMNIKPTVFTSDPAVMRYPLSKRNCYFGIEKKTALGEYTQSDCLVDCRIKSMMSLCECVPFMIPIYKDLVCTLSDIACLSKYKEKWSSLAPTDEIEELLKEKHDALFCDTRCYPSCENTLYQVTTKSIDLHVDETDTQIFSNNSLIHIYYPTRQVTVHHQDVMYSWFEILSNFGGTFGLMIGLSFVSIIELIFYFTYKYYLFAKSEKN